MACVSTFLGIDVGTSGVRVAAIAATGALLGTAQQAFAFTRADGAAHEQEPESWWRVVCVLVRKVSSQLAAISDRSEIRALSVTSTSGTLVLTDVNGSPVRPAIMYDDSRCARQADELNARYENGCVRWNSSSSLPKVLWVREHEEHVWRTVRHILSPADWLLGRLSGNFSISDYSNSLKLGYDFELGTWFPAMASVGVPDHLLPHVVAPATCIGKISPEAATETRIPETCALVTGATDGLTSLIASGATDPGQANTTLGTTLVWKTLSTEKPPSTDGIYSHRHPLGLWAPGAASNTGPGAMAAGREADIEKLDQEAAEHLPTNISSYVIGGRGERFPFRNQNAVTFFDPHPEGRTQTHAAELQALAFTERWGYERIARTGVRLDGPVFSTGSAAQSLLFSKLRACVLSKPVIRCRSTGAAFGAAVLAAGTHHFAGNLGEAIRCTTRVDRVIEPEPYLVPRYEELYRKFREACAARGYGS